MTTAYRRLPSLDPHGHSAPRSSAGANLDMILLGIVVLSLVLSSALVKLCHV